MGVSGDPVPCEHYWTGSGRRVASPTVAVFPRSTASGWRSTRPSARGGRDVGDQRRLPGDGGRGARRARGRDSRDASGGRGTVVRGRRRGAARRRRTVRGADGVSRRAVGGAGDPRPAPGGPRRGRARRACERRRGPDGARGVRGRRRLRGDSPPVCRADGGAVARGHSPAPTGRPRRAPVALHRRDCPHLFPGRLRASTLPPRTRRTRLLVGGTRDARGRVRDAGDRRRARRRPRAGPRARRRRCASRRSR